MVYGMIHLLLAEVAELVDAQASGACGSNVVWVQVPSSALGINRIFAEEAVVSSANCLEG